MLPHLSIARSFITNCLGPIVVAVVMALRPSEVLKSPSSAFRSLLEPNLRDGLIANALHVAIGALFTALPIAWACYLALRN
jgi:hypothetical protein